MRKHFFMPKSAESTVFHRLFTMVEGKEKIVNTYVIQYTRNRHKLRDVSPLGRFLRFGKPENKNEKGVENPEGFGRKGEANFVYEPMPCYCPHTRQVAAAVIDSLNPRLFTPLKEETMRHVKSMAKHGYVNGGGAKSSRVSEIPGTVHFFEVRGESNPNLAGIIDESGRMVCRLDMEGWDIPESELAKRAEFIGVMIVKEKGVYCFSKEIPLLKLRQIGVENRYFTFGDMPHNLELFKNDMAQWMEELQHREAIAISQAEAALRFHTLDFVLREKGMQSLPDGEEARKGVLAEYGHNVFHTGMIPVDIRVKDGERVPLLWRVDIDDVRWMPTFAEFKDAVADLKAAGISVGVATIGAKGKGQKAIEG
ncbi:MAG: hypothetical protein WC861_03675 [Candidatus Micrarchaeia archaeon]|jgi:hypothetical protein